jgi:signal transduction histidine kinase
MERAVPQRNMWHVLWDAYIVGMCAVAVVSVFLVDDLVPGRAPTVAAAVLVALAVWLTVAGRGVPRMGGVGVRSICYVAVATALWALAMWFSPAAVAAVPALYPVIFSTLPLAVAVGTALAVTLVPLAMDVAASGLQSPHLPVAVAMTLLGLIAGPIVGIMVVTTVRQRIRLAAVVAELEHSRAEASRLSRQAGVAAERERLAREIHDTLAQGFTSIVTLAQAVQAELDSDPHAAAKHVELIRNTARANLSEARTMVSSLTPAALDSGSLAAAIRRQCDAFAAETGVPVAVTTDPDLPSSAMASNVVLLRAAQESLANVRKHAGATAVSVTLATDDDVLRLTLADNGIGLGADHHDGYGLNGMRARAAQVGGSLRLAETPGGGVTVVVELPV